MNLAGAILAGGAGTRMPPGTVPKSLLLLAGRPLAGHAADRLAGQVHPLFLNGPVDRGFESLGLPIVPDRRPARLGPLAGMEAVALKVSTACPQVDHILFVPGDTPFLPRDLVASLAGGGGGRIRMAQSAGRLHPTVSLWPLEILLALPPILDQPDAGRSVLGFAESHGFKPVAFAIEGGMDPFFNINRQTDFACASAYLTPDS